MSTNEATTPVAPLHAFRVRDRCFAYAVESCVCAQVDDLALTVLPEIQRGDRALVAGQYGHLFPESELRSGIEQCTEFLDGCARAGNVRPYHHVPESSVRVATLHVAHDCNLRCSYCYADGGAFGGARSLMSLEVMFKAVDFVLEHSGAEEEIHFGFFGGEPLLNLEVMAKGVTYAKTRATDAGKRASFSVVTNATLMTPRVMDFLDHEGFSILFSIDGPQATHDRLRKTAAGKGSHSLALKNVLAYSRDHSDDFTVRGTFTKVTPHFAEHVCYLNDMGFRSVSVEEAQLPATHPQALSSPIALLQVKQEYDRLADIYIDRLVNGHPLSFFHFDNLLADLLMPAPHHTPCAAGSNVIAITPDGRVFPCFEAVPERDNCIGDVRSGFDREKRLIFQRMHVDRYAACRGCWLRYSCGGGCYALGIRYNGSIRVPHRQSCELMKYRFMTAAWILSKAIDCGPVVLQRLEHHLGIQ